MLLWILAVVLIGVGVLGLFLPVLPGTPVMFVGMLVGAWADGFQHLGVGMLVLLGGLAVLTVGLDFLAGMWGAKRFGASNRAMLGAAIGGVVGIFFGLPGLLLGPFFGAVIGELSMRRSLGDAGRAGFGASVGLLVGTAFKVALTFCMLGLFIGAFFL